MRTLLLASAIILSTSSGALGQCRDFESIGTTDGSGVFCMTTFDEDGPGPNPPRLFVGGDFSQINGVAAQNIARWDGASWSGIGDGFTAPVRALAVYDDGSGPALYAGGDFTGKIAKWNGAAWGPVGSGLTANSVYTLQVYDDGSGPALFAGGVISAAGGAPTDNVAAWNGSSWRTFFAGPPARLFPSAAYDSTHNFFVLFGGRNNAGGNTNPVNETWTWNGSSWAQAVGTAPAARYSAPMCFDSLRGRMIMLGGNSNDTRTWAFDGTAWTMIVSSYLLDGQRTAFRVAYDAARDRVVLFGGQATFNNSLFNDTWEFDGTSWAQVTLPHAPSVRRDYAMTYDSTRHRIVLFGGVNNTTGYLPDTWEYDGTDWTQVSSSGPAGTETAAMTFDTVRSRAVMFGSMTGQPNLQTWSWNGTAWTLLDAGIPAYSSRNGAPIAYDIAHDRVVQRDPTGVQWSWNGTAWSTVPGGGPGGLVNALLTHNDGSGTALYACGGFTIAGGNSSSPYIARLTASGWGPVGQGFSSAASSMASYSGALYVAGSFSYAGSVQVDGLARWNGSAWSAVNIPSGTRALRGAGPLSAVTDETGAALFASGPYNSMQSILRWNGSSWSPITSTTPQPTAREYAAMAYDSGRSRSVLFGGTTDGTSAGSRSDTYEWDGRAWNQTATTGPSARWGHTMAFDSLRARTLLVGGGTSFSSGNSQTWSWDGSAWTQLASSFGTTARFQSAAAYDIARDRLVLFGGRDASGAPQSDTWEWNGTAWTQRSVTGPPARYAHAMAYDSDRHRIVLTGGIDSLSHQLYDTWEFDGAQWVLVNNNPSNFTGPISDHCMAYDTTRQRTVIYGGRTGTNANGTFWQWDGQAWTSIGSCDSWANAAAYDSRMQTLVAFGGFWSTQTLDTTDLRSYSGASITLGNFVGALNHDDGSGPAVFVFGSLLGSPPSHVAKWAVACSTPSITTQPQSQTAVFGQNVVLTVAASGGTTPITYQWRRNGINLHNVNNYILGATTAQLTIHGWSLNDAGQYDVLVACPAGLVQSNPATLTVVGSVPGSPVTVTRIVYPPDAVPGIPGATFTGVEVAQIAPTNEVLFRGNATGTDLLLCLWDDGNLQTLYKFGDTIAGTNAGEYVGGSGSGGAMFPRFNVMGSRRFWFTTDLAGPGVDVTNRRALWYQDDSGATLVARRGYQPAGYPAGTVLSKFGDIYPSSSGVGNLAFTSWVDVNGARTGGGVWSWTQSSGQSIVARTGDPAPGLSANYGFFGNGACINADGTVLFGANEPSNTSGVWSSSEGSTSPVLLSGNTAPGAPAGSTMLGVSIDGNVLSDSGRMALWGTFVPPPPFGQAAIYRTDSGIAPVVTQGDSAPGAPTGDTFSVPTLWSMNNAGDVLFASGLVQPPGSCPSGNCPSQGLWIARADGVHNIILNYTPPPAGTPAVFDNIGPHGPGVVNNSGIAIFEAGLTGPAQSGSTGIYGWTIDDGAFPVIVPGTQMEVRPGLFKTVSNSWLSGLTDGSTTLTSNLNDNGDMVAIVTFTDDSRGLFLGRFGDFLVGRFPCRAFVSPLLSTVLEGATTTFAASASGTGVTYQWTHDGADLADDSRISGSHASVLIINNTQPSDGGAYVCNVTNGCGPIASPTATLSVTTRCGSADFNCDGDVGTDADIESFFACLAGNCPAPPCRNGADFNGDGDIGTDADIEAFFRVLAGGAC